MKIEHYKSYMWDYFFYWKNRKIIWEGEHKYFFKGEIDINSYYKDDNLDGERIFY